MDQLHKTLQHSAELSLQVENALTVASLTSGDSIRIEKQIHNLQQQASAIEAMLVELSEQYKSEESSAKQQIWEHKLLDLSLRNNLLNMKLGKNAISPGVTDIAAFEDELDQGKEFIFSQKELKGIYRTMRTNLEETGANTLFLTLGTLNWVSGNKSYAAPIMLMSVEMVAMKGGQFAVRKRDEDVVINITLLEFLKQNYGIQVEGVNPLPQDAHGVDVSLVLCRFADAIKEHEDWQVVEDSVLGIFSFAKFVIWNDIHTHSSAMQTSPIVRSLIEGRLLVNDSDKPVADAREMDVTIRPDNMAVPVDADSSQLEAVADSQSGRSFLLYGPPGTGKSQTITNLIANALYHNKRVLFVAQKKAALDVVEKRLAKIGLAPFCLELHSNKMDKRCFLQQMEKAISNVEAGSSENYKRIANDLFAQRMQLAGFISAMHAKHEIGYSLYECIDKSLSVSVNPMAIPDHFCKGKTKEHVDAVCTEIKELDATTAILDGMTPWEHPLFGFTPKPQKKEVRSMYASSYIKGDSLEEQIKGLPQILTAIKQTMERNSKMSFQSKTTRQYLEGDFKLRKFFQLVELDDALLDDLDSFINAVNRWIENLNRLPQWQQYADKLNNLKDKGLVSAVDMYVQGTPTDNICQAFLAAFYRQLANEIILRDENLSQFQGVLLEQVIDRYKKTTREFQQLTRQELVVRLSSQNNIGLRDPEISAELTLLRKRIGNKGRGASIRTIIDQMPHLLPMLCPVMLMSPLSVAQYLDVDGPKFDLVVFDEASQMPTSEAVGSLARAKSAVIVGDPRQMPPTSFFAVNTTDEDEADIDDLESILDDCISLSMPSRYLGWHYRSKHESLIAFSNENYYEGRLVTFPSVDNMQSKVTWQHVEGCYDFGKTRTNRAEAEAVVADVITRLEVAPDRSIGVVAFSKMQSDLIEDILNEELAKRPDLDQRNQKSDEPLFVKNLENVQGDERDVILFSVGYGPDKEGKVSMNFGPLNKVGGERRLNVAVSRARYEMKVFSTLKPEQIDERRTNAEGVLGLKRFLKFAQNGTLSVGEKDRGECNNFIVEEISEELTKRGYDVHVGIGTSICRLDIGVVNPANPLEYSLGLIVDGKDYYQIKTVRDREVVRPSVLQMLGWRLMHVWTLDWFLHKDMVIKNILAQL